MAPRRSSDKGNKEAKTSMGSPNPPPRGEEIGGDPEPPPAVALSPSGLARLGRPVSPKTRGTSGQGAAHGAVLHRIVPETNRTPTQSDVPDAQDLGQDGTEANPAEPDAEATASPDTVHPVLPVPEDTDSQESQGEPQSPDCPLEQDGQQDGQYVQRHRGDGAVVFIATHCMGKEASLAKGDSEMATDYENLERAFLAKSSLCTGIWAASPEEV